MRQQILRGTILLAVLFIAVVGLAFPAPQAAADPCGRDNQVTCINESLQELNNCCQVFGCDSNWSVNYCADKGDAAYKSCMVLKGCASPPPPQM